MYVGFTMFILIGPTALAVPPISTPLMILLLLLVVAMSDAVVVPSTNATLCVTKPRLDDDDDVEAVGRGTARVSMLLPELCVMYKRDGA